MAQNKATDHGKASTQARANGNKAAAANDTAETAKKATRDAAESSKNAKNDVAETGKNGKSDTAETGKNDAAVTVKSAPRDSAEAAKSATRDAAENAKNATRDAAETGMSAMRVSAESGKNAMRDAGKQVEQHAEKSMDVALQVVEDTGRQLQSAQSDGGDLASFWLHTMQEQATHNVEAMRELAAAREWQDKLKVQSAYFSGSLERLQGVFAHYMEMSGTMMQGHGDAAASSAKRATKVAARP